MSDLINSFDVVGSDRKNYRVDLWERPGREHKPLNGPAQRMRGPREYLLSDGRALLDVSNTEWKIHNTSIRLPKPSEE